MSQIYEISVCSKIITYRIWIINIINNKVLKLIICVVLSNILVKSTCYTGQKMFCCDGQGRKISLLIAVTIYHPQLPR